MLSPAIKSTNNKTNKILKKTVNLIFVINSSMAPCKGQTGGKNVQVVVLSKMSSNMACNKSVHSNETTLSVPPIVPSQNLAISNVKIQPQEILQTSKETRGE